MTKLNVKKLCNELEIDWKIKICNELLQIHSQMSISLYTYEYLFNIVVCLSCTHTNIFTLPYSQIFTFLSLSARILGYEMARFSP